MIHHMFPLQSLACLNRIVDMKKNKPILLLIFLPLLPLACSLGDVISDLLSTILDLFK